MIRSLLTTLLIAVVMPVTALSADLKTYDGSFANIFASIPAIEVESSIARYTYIQGDYDTKTFEGEFNYGFVTNHGMGTLIGTFRDNSPVGSWALVYPLRLKGRTTLMEATALINFNDGIPDGPATYVITPSGSTSVEASETFLFNFGSIDRSSNRDSDLGGKAPVSIFKIIDIIQHLPHYAVSGLPADIFDNETPTEIMIVPD